MSITEAFSDVRDVTSVDCTITVELLILRRSTMAFPFEEKEVIDADHDSHTSRMHGNNVVDPAEGTFRRIAGNATVRHVE